MKWRTITDHKFLVGSIIVPAVLAIIGWIYFTSSNSITNAPQNTGVITQGQTGNNTINITSPKITVEQQQEQRVWVYASQIAVGGVKWKDGEAKFDVRVVLKNTGHAPALSVEMLAVAYTSVDLAQLLKKQHELSEQQRHHPANFGTMVFPGEPVTLTQNIPLGKDEVTKFQESINSIRKDNNLEAGPITFVPTSILIVIDYLLPDKMEHHQTGYVMNLFFHDPAQPNAPGLALPIDRDVPAVNLRLEDHKVGQYAD